VPGPVPLPHHAPPRHTLPTRTHPPHAFLLPTTFFQHSCRAPTHVPPVVTITPPILLVRRGPSTRFTPLPLRIHTARCAYPWTGLHLFSSCLFSPHHTPLPTTPTHSHNNLPLTPRAFARTRTPHPHCLPIFSRRTTFPFFCGASGTVSATLLTASLTRLLTCYISVVDAHRRRAACPRLLAGVGFPPSAPLDAFACRMAPRT